MTVDVVFSPDLEGMDSGSCRSEWVCGWLALCVVDPVSDLMLFLEVGVQCLRREVVLCHGGGERNKGHRDPPQVYIPREAHNTTVTILISDPILGSRLPHGRSLAEETVAFHQHH
jgi:hypothetical protein